MPPESSLAVFVKRDCPTCQLVEPIVRTLSMSETAIGVYSQDDPSFPANLPAVVDDRGWFGIERVPLSWTRGLGLALLAAGAALTLRR